MRGTTEVVVLVMVSGLPFVSVGEVEGGNEFAFPFPFLFFFFPQ